MKTENLSTPISNERAPEERVSPECAFNERAFDEPTFGGFMGTSPIMQDVYDVIRTVAPSQAPIFITGETGTGKEIAAQTIHDYSRRRDKPFIALNCASIPHDLFESELFGHITGAFTGALENRMGAIRTAMGGTLFLDEVGELPPALQAKLLRVLQTHYVVPLGSDMPIKTDFRLICATNKDVPTLLAEKTLRDDLFHRLYILPIHLPPLNERGDDIALLANYFVQFYLGQEGKSKPLTLEHSAMVALQNHRWVGNVRQLQNVIQRAVIMAQGDSIGRDDLMLNDAYDAIADKQDNPLHQGQIVFTTGTTLAHAENTIIKATLLHVGGNKSKAARILGIDVSTLRRKLSNHDRE